MESKQMENYGDQSTSNAENLAGDSAEAKDTTPGLLELSKPSEFRLKALKQKKYVNCYAQAS